MSQTCWFLLSQGDKKGQKRRNKQHNAALLKTYKTDVIRKSYTGLTGADIEVNTHAVVQQLREADLVVDFTDGEIMRAINMVNTCPMPCQFCGHLSGMGALVPLECACDWHANHGMSKPFFPKLRVICGSCSTARFDKGEFKACLCVRKCLEHCRRTSLWRFFLATLLSSHMFWTFVFQGLL